MGNRAYTVPIEVVPSSGGGGSGTVTQVNTAGIATGGPITTTGTVTIAGSGNTTTAATATAGIHTAPAGDVVTTDGSGNVQDSGTLLSSLVGSSAPGGTVLGNNTTSTAAATYNTAPVLGIPGTSTGTLALASSTASGKYTITAPANAATPTLTLPTGAGTFCTSASSPLTLNATTGAMTFSGSGAITWDQIGNAAGNLTLANGANTTTFNQTSAVNWAWANTTAAVVGTNQNSPAHVLSGTYFGSTAGVLAASATDSWTVRNVLTPVQLSGTGSITTIAESAGSVVTLTTVGNTFQAGALVQISGLSAGTWLNGYTVSLLTANGAGTSLTFNDPTAHGTLGSTGLTGTPVLTQVSGISALTISETGVGGGTVVVGGGAALATQSAGTAGTISLQNTTVATSGTTNISPALQLEANYWNGSVSLIDTWAIESQLSAGTNAASTLQLTHIGGATSLFVNFNNGNTATTYFQLAPTNAATALNAGASNIYLTVNGDVTTNSNTGGSNGFGVKVQNQSNFTGTTVGGQQGILQVNGTFSPASGSTNFYGAQILPTINQTSTASGSYTGLLVSAIETSLKGTANKLLSLQAGSGGTTVKYEINNAGVVDEYNGIATVRNGQAAEYASSDLTAQTAAITATTLYATTATAAYRVSWSATITTAASVSSVLGGTNGFQVLYTSPTDSVVKTTVAGNSVTSAANTTGTAVGGVEVIYAKSGTNIQFTYDYTSSGTAMAYELHVSLEQL